MTVCASVDEDEEKKILTREISQEELAARKRREEREIVARILKDGLYSNSKNRREKSSKDFKACKKRALDYLVALDKFYENATRHSKRGVTLDANVLFSRSSPAHFIDFVDDAVNVAQEKAQMTKLHLALYFRAGKIAQAVMDKIAALQTQCPEKKESFLTWSQATAIILGGMTIREIEKSLQLAKLVDKLPLLLFSGVPLDTIVEHKEMLNYLYQYRSMRVFWLGGSAPEELVAFLSREEEKILADTNEVPFLTDRDKLTAFVKEAWRKARD